MVRPTSGWSTRPARAPWPWSRRWPTSSSRAEVRRALLRCPPAPRTGCRPGALSTSVATPPRWRGMPLCWCIWQATSARRQGWGTCSRTPPMSRASRCASGAEEAHPRPAGITASAVLAAGGAIVARPGFEVRGLLSALGLLALAEHRRRALDLVLAHIAIHVLPAHKHRGFGGLGVEVEAVFQPAQRMAAGATDGPGFLVALGYARVGAQSGDLVAAGKQQTAGKSQQAQRGGRGRGLHPRAGRRSHRAGGGFGMGGGTRGTKKAPEEAFFAGGSISPARRP